MAFVPIYIVILGITIVVDYFAGIFLEETEGKKRKVYLVASLIANIGVLCIFKYYNFFNDNLTSILYGAGFKNPMPYLSILLPIGLSFHTFQAMSYTIEVYRGNQKAERHFGIYALYVMFYPQLVAGPIERPQNLLHQFYEEHSFDLVRISDGLKQMLFGFIKKLVIADRLSLYVDTVYNNAGTQSGITLAVATIFFAIQIYCDFSGYSDIAIGSAKVMGFDLMKNFNRPYFATSISDFWRRWHISLSTWFKDYLYIPLGGSRVKSKIKKYSNLIIVFLISGFWHGANWTFVIWGGLNGIFLVIESATGLVAAPKNIFKRIFQTLITFLLICITWIFFRASSAEQGLKILTKIMQMQGSLYMGNPKDHFYYGILFILLLIVYEFKQEFFPHSIKMLHHKHVAVRYIFYLLSAALLLLFGVFDGGQFIYFQF